MQEAVCFSLAHGQRPKAASDAAAFSGAPSPHRFHGTLTHDSMKTLEYLDDSTEVNHELNPDRLAEIVVQHAVRLLSDILPGSREVSKEDFFSIPGGFRCLQAGFRYSRPQLQAHRQYLCAPNSVHVTHPHRRKTGLCASGPRGPHRSGNHSQEKRRSHSMM